MPNISRPTSQVPLLAGLYSAVDQGGPGGAHHPLPPPPVQDQETEHVNISS